MKSKAGETLIETMISLMLFALIIGAITQIFMLSLGMISESASLQRRLNSELSAAARQDTAADTVNAALTVRINAATQDMPVKLHRTDMGLVFITE